MRKHSLIGKFCLISLALSALACSYSPGHQPTVTLIVLPTQIPTTTHTALPEKEVSVLLDPCSLATADEIGVILGGPVDIQPYQEIGGCNYSLQNTDPAAVKSLGISVIQDEMAKDLVFRQLGMAAASLGRDTDFIQGLAKQMRELTLQEMLEQIFTVYQNAGGEVTSYADLGDAAYWIKSSAGETFVVTRGDVCVWIKLVGSDLETASDQLASLVQTMLERLPVAFYVSPKVTETVYVENAEAALLDVCSLITAEEAEVILGGPVDVSHDGPIGACYYSTEIQSTDRSMSLFASQGEEAKSHVLFDLNLQMMTTGWSDVMSSVSEELSEQLPEMTLQEMMAEVSERLQETGVGITPYAGLGDAAYWLPLTDFSTEGQLFAVSGDTYVRVTLLDEDDRALSTPSGELAPLDRSALIAQTILERLPSTFYPNSGIGIAWVASPSTGQVFVIDSQRNRIASTIDVGGTPVDIVADRRGAWVAGGTEGVIRWLDRFNFQVVNTFPVGGNVLKVAVAPEESIWVCGDFGVKRIDPLTGDQQDVFSGNCYDMELGENVMWVTQPQDRQVLKIDLMTHAVISTMNVEGQPTDIALRLGFIWVILEDTGEIVQIDPQVGSILSSTSVGETATALAGDSYHVWYTGKAGLGYVGSNSIVESARVPGPFSDITVGEGGSSFWVTNPDEGIVIRMYPDASGLTEFGDVVKFVTGGTPFVLAIFP